MPTGTVKLGKLGSLNRSSWSWAMPTSIVPKFVSTCAVGSVPGFNPSSEASWEEMIVFEKPLLRMKGMFGLRRESAADIDAQPEAAVDRLLALRHGVAEGRDFLGLGAFRTAIGIGGYRAGKGQETGDGVGRCHAARGSLTLGHEKVVAIQSPAAVEVGFQIAAAQGGLPPGRESSHAGRGGQGGRARCLTGQG
jgi:hypothetical protein